MDMNNAIDSKPRPRSRAARRRLSDRALALGGAEHQDDTIDDTDVEQVLNVRVKERDTETGTRKTRLGSLFKEPPATAIKSLLHKDPAAQDIIKQTLKRPLTGLFRRPASRGASTTATNATNAPSSKEGAKPEISDTNVESIASTYHQGERSVTPEIPSIDRRLIHESVARAPGISVNRVAAMYQLDALNAKNAYLAKLDDIDLSLLSRYLCSEDEIKDEKVIWSWEYVFASISSEMREEWALDEEQEDDAYDGTHHGHS